MVGVDRVGSFYLSGSKRAGVVEDGNAQLSVTYIRPLSKKWSLLAVAGVGLFMDTGSLAYVRWNHVMGMGVAAAVWHLTGNFDLGMGVALNTSFGYPMLFPAFFVDWRIEGRYMVTVSMMDGAETGRLDGRHACLCGARWQRQDLHPTVRHCRVAAGADSHEVVLHPITIGLSAYRAAYYASVALKYGF